LVPGGKHDWRRFVTPAELGTGLRRAGLRLAEIAGLSYQPLRGEWRVGRDLGVNYIALAERG